MPSRRENLSSGRSVNVCQAENVQQLALSKGTEGYDFVVINVSHPRCCLDPNELAQKARELSGGAGELMPKSVVDQLLPPMTVADISLTSHNWSRLVVGRPSPWIDPDSSDPYIRRLSEQALRDELSYFAYLSVPAIIVRLRGPNHANLARIVHQSLIGNPSSAYAVWIEVPVTAPAPTEVRNGYPERESDDTTRETTQPSAAATDGPETADNGSEYETMLKEYEGPTQPIAEQEQSKDTWHWFYEFRRACNNHRRVSLILELTADLPESEIEFARWKGEPLAAIKFDTHTFLTNKPGFPVLSKAHQNVTKEFFLQNPQCLVDGPTLHFRRPRKLKANEQPEPVDPTCLYYAYLNNLWKTNSLAPTQMVEWASGYEDYLQLPLQPLGDHLESEVYETFERDPVKYQQYYEAFEQAVAVKTESWPPDQALIVMVLGAGRGPLVSCSYEVLKKSGLKFKLYAVEKNPCAVVTLNSKLVEEWNNEVEVVFSDMRDFKPEDKADIVISELLGSFGCNELSPECLDGALHVMKPDCISIPTHYRSYIAPVHSPRLFNEVRSTSEKEHNPLVAFESPYVCRIFNQFEIAGCKVLFRFDHPNWKLASNERYQVLDFIARESCEMMGVVGYFYASLYGRASLSTVPKYETSGLCSWFPILFSLQTPVYVKKGEHIRVHFWRLTSKSKVWYEWQLVEPVVTPIMNPGGRSYSIRLF